MMDGNSFLTLFLVKKVLRGKCSFISFQGDFISLRTYQLILIIYGLKKFKSIICFITIVLTSPD